jgi:hypothetical protein
MERSQETDLMWRAPLGILAQQLSAMPVTIDLIDATIQTDGTSSAALAPIPCSAVLRLGGASGFELTFQAAPEPRAMMQLVAWSMGTPAAVLMLTGHLSTGERVTGRCKHLADSHFDLNDNTARGALTSLYIEIEASADQVGVAPGKELVVGSPAWMPSHSVRSDGHSLAVAPDKSIPSLELATLHLEHERVDDTIVIRLLRARDEHPDDAVGKILDVMSFIAGCRLFPHFIRQELEGRAVLRVFRRRQSSTSRMSPIPVGDGTSLSLNAWRLFAALYQFLERQKEPPGHRCALTRAMAEVHGALRADYISTRALIVSIAVESLVNDYIIGSPPLTKETANELILVAKRGLTNVRSDVVSACCATIGRMASPNTHNALMAMAQVDIVNADKAKRWRDVRAKLAHGHLSDPSLAVEAFRLSLDLFHRIAASIVGFDGVVLESGEAGENRVDCRPVPAALRCGASIGCFGSAPVG